MGKLAVMLVCVFAVGHVWAAPPPEDAVRTVAQKYRELVHRSYTQVLEKNRALHQAAEKLAREPSPEKLNQAREAWKAARLAYSPTEAFRFYGGPIDDAEKGPEALINAWPIDESYLDGVKGNPGSGIIQNAKEFPKLTAETLAEANEKGGERNVSTGYHAIEFLLWGQDFSTTGPGDRSADDFRKSQASGERRGKALTALTGLLVRHTEDLVRAWEPGAPYAQAFVKETPQEILRRILVGASSLSGDEMASERLGVALEKNDPEHEQDCFSDFSLEDLKANQRGVEMVLRDTGLLGLMKKSNTKIAASLEKRLAQSARELDSIPGAFDQILADRKHPGRGRVNAAIKSLAAQAKEMGRIAKIWGVDLTTAEE